MKTQTLPTVCEIITTTLERVEEIAAAANVRCATFHTELQDPRDHALLNAIHDLLDIGDAHTTGRAERVEAAHALLEEFSEGAQKYAVKYDEMVEEVRLAHLTLAA